MSGIWELGKRLLHDELVNMVTTRSHKEKLVERSLPESYIEEEASALRSTESSVIAECLTQMFNWTGVPYEILTDSVKNFISKFLKELYDFLGVNLINIIPYHPATDRMVERFDSTLKAMSRKTLKQWKGRWDLALPHLLGEYYRTPSKITGFTPSELLFGRKIKGPLQARLRRWTTKESTPVDIVTQVVSMQKKLEDIKEFSKTQEKKSKTRYKEQYDKKTKKREYEIGGLIMLRTHGLGPKMDPKWKGPYTMTNCLDKTTYEFSMPDHP